MRPEARTGRSLSRPARWTALLFGLGLMVLGALAAITGRYAGRTRTGQAVLLLDGDAVFTGLGLMAFGVALLAFWARRPAVAGAWMGVWMVLGVLLMLAPAWR
ncbi:hypothetical protein Ga0061063_0087 [Gulbenkiania indica]|uniref:Uncharacterized protein n=1 Tax=Gulbenkiania indica TaxID=375574 RepID=A0A0K6H852_9NEIS|nr:hypothetical protein [Gulbenkiania indica]CUA87161.1 hypothetical protein Ga0061063_0087 [Gulbenkiania indica]